MKKIILFLHYAFSFAILSGGVPDNAFVATPSGHIEIGRLTFGDRVSCLDEKFNLDEGLITAIQDYSEEELVEIITEDGNCIQVSKQQKLFSFHRKEWIEAHTLTPGESLLKKDGSSIKVTNVNTKHSMTKMRSITVDTHHNFFVGKSGILVHNLAFVLPILSWGAGAAVTWFEGVTLAGIVTAVVGLVVKEKVMEGIEKATGITIQSKQSVAYIGAAKGAHNQPEEISHSPKFLADSAGGIVTAEKTPGLPGEKDGFVPPKKWDGKKVPNPNGHGYGYPDKNGNVWFPTGENGHGAPHWDVQDPKTGKHTNVMPGGNIRGEKRNE